MKNIIFIAPPAAGKGTMSEILMEKDNYKHISTGDILREMAKKEDDMAKNILHIARSTLSKKIHCKDGLFFQYDELDNLSKNI